MTTINTKTNIVTVYAGFGRNPDGTWKKITARQDSLTKASEFLNEYIEDVENYPDTYTNYEEYKIQKRTEITVVEDWQDL